jgi:hypothetical protein
MPTASSVASRIVPLLHFTFPPYFYCFFAQTPDQSSKSEANFKKKKIGTTVCK